MLFCILTVTNFSSESYRESQSKNLFFSVSQINLSLLFQIKVYRNKWKNITCWNYHCTKLYDKDDKENHVANMWYCLSIWRFERKFLAPKWFPWMSAFYDQTNFSINICLEVIGTSVFFHAFFTWFVVFVIEGRSIDPWKWWFWCMKKAKKYKTLY